MHNAEQNWITGTRKIKRWNLLVVLDDVTVVEFYGAPAIVGFPIIGVFQTVFHMLNPRVEALT